MWNAKSLHLPNVLLWVLKEGAEKWEKLRSLTLQKNKFDIDVHLPLYKI